MSKKAKSISGIIILILFFAGIIVLMNSLVVTKENQFTIIKRFGKIEKVVDEAGLSFKNSFHR